MPTLPVPTENVLLAMLPPAVNERLQGESVIVTANAGDVLLEAGERIEELYFPLDLVVSSDQKVADEATDESGWAGAALTGNEGVVGYEPLFDAETAVSRLTVRIGGRAIRVNVKLMRDEFARSGAFHRLTLRFVDALLTQVCATGACERAHSVQQRLIRWLLSFADRVPSGDLSITQESLSQLMSVRRVSVSAAASALQDLHLISYRRGMLNILDRAGLLKLSCKCYRETRDRYAAYLLPD